MTKQQWLGMLSLVDEKYVLEANPDRIQSKKQFRWKKFSVIAASIILSSIAAVASGIYLFADKTLTNSIRLEWGFQYAGNGIIPKESCAYKSETNTFDIDNVTLTFYFGGVFAPNISEELISGSNIPEFDLYFANAQQEPIYTIRHSFDNFVSEEYRLTWELIESSNFVKMQFNHSEKVTIPREIISESHGIIRFCVGGINVNESIPQYKTITSAYINYEIIDDKVVLSPWNE